MNPPLIYPRLIHEEYPQFFIDTFRGEAEYEIKIFIMRIPMLALALILALPPPPSIADEKPISIGSFPSQIILGTRDYIEFPVRVLQDARNRNLRFEVLEEGWGPVSSGERTIDGNTQVTHRYKYTISNSGKFTFRVTVKRNDGSSESDSADFIVRDKIGESDF